MRNFLATSAIALLAAAPLSAQTQPAASGDSAAPSAVGVMVFVPGQTEGEIFGSDLIGMDVESSQTDYATTYADNRPASAADRSNWDDIGEVNDILISTDGTVKAVLVDVGGFLGMGEHTVALDMSRVHLMTDDTGARFVAVNSSEEELKQAPEFQRTDRTAAAAPMTNGTGAMGTAPAAGAGGTGMMAGNMAAPIRPTNAREGYTDVDYGTLTAEQLKGANVYGANDEDVGKIGQLILSADGKISQAVVDVGGFLGIGAHSVALPFDQMQIMHNDSGNIRVYIDAVKKTLEDMPEYKS